MKTRSVKQLGMKPWFVRGSADGKGAAVIIERSSSRAARAWKNAQIAAGADPAELDDPEEVQRLTFRDNSALGFKLDVDVIAPINWEPEPTDD